ncbi:hypothetical protein C0J45_15963 [Silurus meridionalis]|nr:hypothetical protein C0J45_15963 [Silurus meridionalis]
MNGRRKPRMAARNVGGSAVRFGKKSAAVERVPVGRHFPVSRAQSPASSSSSSSFKPCSLSRLFHPSFNCHPSAVKTLLPAVANMAKINPCFKKIFITFNSLFAILGVVLFSLAMIGHRYTDQIPNMYGVIALYVIGSVIFIFSCLGVFAAYKESKWALIVPCVDVIIYYVEKLLSIFLGLMFGLAALAILGGMMSFGMIIRVSALDPSPSQFSSQFPSLPLSYSPPKYSEVVNY